MAEVVQVIDAAEPRHGDPAEALARVVAANWRTLGRYHALVSINTQHHGQAELRERHYTVLGTLEPLIESGQADGTCRGDVPAAWHLSRRRLLEHAAHHDEGLEPHVRPRPSRTVLLTDLLLDRLKNSAPARVVTVSSNVQGIGRIEFDDLQGERSYSGARAYNQSKLANVLFTYELARRLHGTGVTANALSNCSHQRAAPPASLRSARRGRIAADRGREYDGHKTEAPTTAPRASGCSCSPHPPVIPAGACQETT